MNLTARQVELLNSTNPQDNAELLASLGGDQQLLSQLVNLYGPGGANYNGNNYGMTASNVAQSAASVPESIKAIYKANGIMDANGNFLKHQDNNGNWVDGPPGGSYSAATNINPGSSWAGMNASGGFTGGTGVGITSPGVTNNNGTYSPVTLAQLAGGGASTTTAPPPGATAGGGGSNPITPAATGGAAGGTGAGGGGSTTAGNTGATGGLPTASASTYSSGTPYTPPSSVTNPFDFYNDEGYKFRLKEGQNALENTAAARGNLNSGATLKALTNYASGLASQEYDNAFNRYNSDRNFNQNVATDARNYNNANNQWDATFNNNNRMWDTTFNNNNRIDARNFDYNAATNDRNFNEDTRRFDLGFNYNAANNDANRNYGNSQFLAGLGANANNSAAQLYVQLAQLLSSNNLTGAGANAAGNQSNANSYVALMKTLFPWMYDTGATQPTNTRTTP